VPEIVDAILTGRGAWRWGSNALGGDVETGILANFIAGEQLLVQSADGRLSQVDPIGLGVTDRGALPHGLQNPIQVFDATVWFDRDGLTVPQVVGSSGGPTPIDASAPKCRYGTVWGGYVMAANQPGHEDTLYFGPPGPKTSGAWDTNAFQETDNAITGVAALRSIGLVFHAASVERLRGTSVPSTAAGDPGDLTLEPLFRRVGCTDARAIAYWNENVIFADEHGVHITDGAVVRNLVQQGSISSYWRPLYQNRTSLAAAVFLDYYIISVVRSDGIADTLVCDLNQRQWFRFSNIASIAMISSGGSTGMERFWGSMKGTQRLGRLGPCFFPDLTQGLLVDDNGVPVMPEMQTPWYRLGPEGRKRIRFAYLSYDARTSTTALDAHAAQWRGPLEAEAPEQTITNENAPVLSLGYIRSPQDPSYVSIGQLPSTNGYTRFRLPVNQAPYGLAFQVKQTAQTAVLRVFDFALEAQGTERSRL
jgi:hypothetical protein